MKEFALLEQRFQGDEEGGWEEQRLWRGKSGKVAGTRYWKFLHVKYKFYNLHHKGVGSIGKHKVILEKSKLRIHTLI